MQKKNVIVTKLETIPTAQKTTEFVERKGLGHPDYIADAIAEMASLGLSRYYKEHFGVILHHNVDKVLVVGGQAQPRFGGGEVLRPIRIIVAGRATTTVELEQEGRTVHEIVPVEEVVIDEAKSWIRNNFRFLDPDRHVVVECAIGSGSVDLVGLFRLGLVKRIPLANDTSLGVGFAPLTPTEKIVYEVERYINSRDFKQRMPAAGEDVKVMAFRRNTHVTLTVACAFISHLVRDRDEYISLKEELKRRIEDHIVKIAPELEVEVHVNTGDDPEHGIFYLTVTGTSAEHGDDGCTGRGNRVRGLITPMRPMSMEAAAGKNPVSHIGKLYNVIANLIAERIYNEIHDIDEVYVYLLSQIGKPINEPLAVHVELVTKRQITTDIKREIESIVSEELDNITRLTELIVSNQLPIPLF